MSKSVLGFGRYPRVGFTLLETGVTMSILAARAVALAPAGSPLSVVRADING